MLVRNENSVQMLQDIISENRHMLGLAYEYFLKLKNDLAKDIEATGNSISKNQAWLTEAIVQKSPNSQHINILNCLEVVREANLKIAQCVFRKNKEHVLFTDKAVKELKETFLAVDELFGHINDLLATNNTVLAQHIMKRAREIGFEIGDYNNEHEERLIKGICMPKSSIIYLLMMNSLNDMAYMAGNIAKEISD